MKKEGIILFLSCLCIISVVGQTSKAIPKNTNERNVIAFYEAGLNRKDFAAVSQYIGTSYKQHNPTAADGIQGFKKYIDFLKENYAQAHWTFLRVFSDGNYVFLHVHEQLTPSSRGSAVIDIYRLEEGKIIEHWDVVQPIPEKPANPNTMFQAFK